MSGRRGNLERAGVGEVALVDVPWGKPLKTNPRRLVRVVTKAVCSDRIVLEDWCRRHGVPIGWVHRSRRGWWHVDLWGRKRDRVRREAE